MFNLLPEQQKKNLDKEYKLRKYYIVLCFVIATLVVASIFILPSFIKSTFSLKVSKERGEQLKAMVGDQNQVSSAAVHELTVETNALAVASSMPLSVYIKNIVADAPNGVHIKEFQRLEGIAGIVSISGVADTRTELLAFSDKLKADALFSNVDLPIESLAADKNASFGIKLTIK